MNIKFKSEIQDMLNYVEANNIQKVKSIKFNNRENAIEINVNGLPLYYGEVNLAWDLLKAL
jgi:hypothetical protein